MQMTFLGILSRTQGQGSLILCCLAPLVLASVLLAQSHSHRTMSFTGTTQVTNAPPGFYFEVSPCPRCHRCRPCALNDGWQRRLMALLRDEGSGSFPGSASQSSTSQEAFSKKAFEPVAAIRKFPKAKAYDTMVYVGPFKSEDEAIEALGHWCPLLEEVGPMDSSCKEMVDKREGNYFYTAGSFDVRGLRVLPK